MTGTIGRILPMVARGEEMVQSKLTPEGRHRVAAGGQW
jgi:hypothetical protein